MEADAPEEGEHEAGDTGQDGAVAAAWAGSALVGAPIVPTPPLLLLLLPGSQPGRWGPTTAAVGAAATTLAAAATVRAATAAAAAAVGAHAAEGSAVAGTA